MKFNKIMAVPFDMFGSSPLCMVLRYEYQHKGFKWNPSMVDEAFALLRKMD